MATLLHFHTWTEARNIFHTMFVKADRLIFLALGKMCVASHLPYSLSNALGDVSHLQSPVNLRFDKETGSYAEQSYHRPYIQSLSMFKTVCPVCIGSHNNVSAFPASMQRLYVAPGRTHPLPMVFHIPRKLGLGRERLAALVRLEACSDAPTTSSMRISRLYENLRACQNLPCILGWEEFTSA
jgi:hypothetical protein